MWLIGEKEFKCMYVVCLIGWLLLKIRIEIYCGVFFKNRINLFKFVNLY